MVAYKGFVPDQSIGLEKLDGNDIGRNPKEMTVDELNKLGYHKTSLVKVIRAKCLDCVHTVHEIRKCTSVLSCALWPYRMGSNPFSERTGNPHGVEALKAWREKQKTEE